MLRQSELVSDTPLARLSPLGWEHIGPSIDAGTATAACQVEVTAARNIMACTAERLGFL